MSTRPSTRPRSSPKVTRRPGGKDKEKEKTGKEKEAKEEEKDASGNPVNPVASPKRGTIMGLSQLTFEEELKMRKQIEDLTERCLQAEREVEQKRGLLRDQSSKWQGHVEHVAEVNKTRESENSQLKHEVCILFLRSFVSLLC